MVDLRSTTVDSSHLHLTISEFTCILSFNTDFLNTKLENRILEIRNSFHDYFQSRNFGAWHDGTARTITVSPMDAVSLALLLGIQYFISYRYSDMLDKIIISSIGYILRNKKMPRHADL